MIPTTVNKPNLFASLLMLLGLMLFSGSLQAQLTIEWDRTYGGNGYEEMNAALPTSDGGYIYGGITTTRSISGEITQHTKDTVAWPEPEGDFWILKTDGQGNPVWDKIIGGFAQDRLWSIVETEDGGYLVGGDSRSGTGADKTWTNRGEKDFWVVKLDGNGNKQWDRAYGGTGNEELRKIIALPNGQYWLTGFSNSPASFEKSTPAINSSVDFWSVRIDENGTPLGDYTFGGSELDELFDAALSQDGNILLTGPSTSPTGFSKTAPYFGSNDIWLVKCSPNGTILWDAAFGGNREDVPQRLISSKDGGYFIIGQSTSDKSTGNKTAEHFGGDDAWLLKFTDTGAGVNILWDKSFGGSASDYGYGVVESGIGNLFVLGASLSPADSTASNKLSPPIGGKDYWALFLEPNGTIVWDQSLGGLGDDVGTQLFQAHDYGYMLGGNSSSNSYPPYKSEDNRGPSYSNDMWVIRAGCAFPGPELDDLPKTCRDEQISVDASIPAPCIGCTYHWDDGGSGPVRNFSPDSTTQVKVTVVHPDGCEFSDSTILEIIPGPDAYQSSMEPVTCFGSNDASFFIEDVSGIAPPYQFSLNGSEWEDVADYTNMKPGIYHLEILDTNGCKLDTSFYIAQPEQVLVELGDDIYLEYGDSVQLQALTNLLDSFSFEWGQPNLVSCTDCLEPWVRPLYTTTVSIELKDKNGCSATDNLRLIVQKTDAVYIPNSFSPNLDNTNDFFTVFADHSVRHIKSLLVFDRWGELMFENYNFQPNKEQIGWDGKHRGQWLDPAIFTYFAVVEFVDGRVALFNGDVVLIR